MSKKNLIQAADDSRGAVHMLAVVVAVFVLGSLVTLIGLRTYQQRDSARQETVMEQEIEKATYEKISIDEVIAVLPSEREPKSEVSDDEEKPARSSEQRTQKPAASPEPKKDQQRDKQQKPSPTNDLKLTNLRANRSGESVVVQGSLPRSIGGTCQALLKPTDKQAPHKAHHIEASSSSQNNCRVNVPRSKLSGDYSSWRVYLSFYSSDKSLKASWHYITDVSF